MVDTCQMVCEGFCHETHPTAAENMSTPINDGGPAFPVPQYQNTLPGMSLRDWFAGQALAGITANADNGWADHNELSNIAFIYADAMLAARNQNTTDQWA